MPKVCCFPTKAYRRTLSSEYRRGRGTRNVRIELWRHGGDGTTKDGSRWRRSGVVRLRVMSVVRRVRSLRSDAAGVEIWLPS
ncbi:hypothetical protein Bca101_082144 [Brassica carinata]